MSEHYVFEDGLALPARVAGHPALEFCNTLAGWDAPPGSDYLTSYDHLAVWSGYVGLVAADHVARLRATSQLRPAEADSVLTRARQVRADLYEVLTLGSAGRSFDQLADEIQAAGAQLRLQRRGGGVVRRIDPKAGLDAPLVAALWSSSELLVSPDRLRVRACPGHGCGWLFINRTGRRRWCMMATCGNRAKARRYAERTSRNAQR
jgi:predicted RNA-binding Zn ribbon-like protein